MRKNRQDRILSSLACIRTWRRIFAAPFVLLVAVVASGQLRPDLRIIARHELVLHRGAFPSSTAPQVNKTRNTLSFSGSDIHLLILAGPETDMFSYKIAGLTNPTLRVPAGVRIRLTVVNVDDDMTHDLVIWSPYPSFPVRAEVPSLAVHTRSLPPRRGTTYSAEAVVIQALKPGSYEYFCSVPGHAKGGMHGRLEVVRGPGMK